jgi:hypothetical protein
VAPPRRRAAEAKQARRLGGDAVHGDELLLLADGVEKAKRVAAEADQRDRAEHEQADDGRGERACALTRAARREHEERQHQPGRDLHADADRERRCAGAQARVRAGSQREREREHQHDQRVVVRAADREHEQQRIEPDERACPASRAPKPAGSARDQRDRAEAARDRDRLERPQRAADAERHGRVAEQREQRAVWRVLVGPAEEREDFIARRLRRDVRVWVEPVQRAHPREADVAEHVLREQRRTGQQDHVRCCDRDGDRSERQAACEQQHEHVARAHDQRQRLKTAGAERQVQPFERACQPWRPTAAACRHVLRRFAGRTGARQEDRDDHAEQSEQAQRTRHGRGSRRALPPRALAGAPRSDGGSERRFGHGRGLHQLIVTATRGQASGWKGRIPSHARVTLATSCR